MLRPMGRAVQSAARCNSDSTAMVRELYDREPSDTYWPWESPQQTERAEPDVWFQDIFRADGTAYRQAEVDLMRELTAR